MKAEQAFIKVGGDNVKNKIKNNVLIGMFSTALYHMIPISSGLYMRSYDFNQLW